MTGRMWKYLWCPALVLAAGLFHWQCSENPAAPSSQPGKRSPSNVIVRSKETVAESANRFGLKLFREINHEAGNQNIFISPLSVSMALGMTYNGAGGSTRVAMAQTLELAGLNIQEVNEIYQDMLNFLPQLDPHVQMAIANSIWYRDDWETPKVEFLDVCQEYFDALVTGLDFDAPDAADIINAWVNEQTHGNIQDIVSGPIDPWVAMFLIDAVYFKGAWKYQFDENSTFDWPFHCLDGSEISCRLMSQKNVFKYFSNADLKILEMPYGDGIFSMTIFLPNAEIDIDQFIAQLDPEFLDDRLNCLTVGDSVDVFIPKFTLEYELLMNDALRALKMEIAFTPQADFSNMYSGGEVWIDKAEHKTFVEVNETGTEAAGIAEFVIALCPNQPIFIANRPFLFMIRENTYQTILFIGKVVDPSAG